MRELDEFDEIAIGVTIKDNSRPPELRELNLKNIARWVLSVFGHGSGGLTQIAHQEGKNPLGAARRSGRSPLAAVIQELDELNHHRVCVSARQENHPHL